MHELTGSRLGPYLVGDRIGAGGMGVVYRARDERLGRDVAVKVIREEAGHTADRLARFEREVRAVAQLSHSCILAIHDFGQDRGITYAVTELLEGETLRDCLDRKRLSWKQALEIGAAVADGLAAAHQVGISHRDIKPSNIFLTADGRVKILDFGLAGRPLRSTPEATTVSRNTDPGTVLGTAGYMAPEQVRGEPTDGRSDIFSLGCVLFEMLSGCRAFAGDTAVEIMNAILKEEPQELSLSGLGLPPELSEIVARCLDKRPAARFQSASDLAYSLRAAGRSSAASHSRAHVDEERRRRFWPVAAAVVMIVFALTLLWWEPWNHPAVQESGEDETQWLVVDELENRTGDPSFDNLGKRAMDEIIQGFTEIGQSAGVLTMEAVPYQQGSGVAGMPIPSDGPPTGSVGPEGPHTMLGGAVYLDGEELELRARITDYDSGGLVYAFPPIRAPRSELAQALAELRNRVAAAMIIHWSKRTDLRINTPPADPQVLFANRDSRRHSNAGEVDEAMAAVERAFAIQPDDLGAWFQKELVLRAAGRYQEVGPTLETAEQVCTNITPFERYNLAAHKAFERGDQQAYLSLMRRMVEIAPHINYPRFNVVLVLTMLNRPREALDFAAQKPELFPYNWIPLLLQAHHVLGEYEEELAGARRELESHPDAAVFHQYEAAALAAMGRVDEVDWVIKRDLSMQRPGTSVGNLMLTAAVELAAHGHQTRAEELAHQAAEWCDRFLADTDSPELEGLFVCADAMRAAGRLEQSRQLVLALRDRSPRRVWITGQLGVLAARSGEYAEARRISEELAAMDDAEQRGSTFYWRACIAAWLDEKERAVELLGRAFTKGYPHRVEDHRDIDLEPLWGDPRFQELIQPKG